MLPDVCDTRAQFKQELLEGLPLVLRARQEGVAVLVVEMILQAEVHALLPEALLLGELLLEDLGVRILGHRNPKLSPNMFTLALKANRVAAEFGSP